MSPKTVAALRGAEAHGVLVIVATGRPPRWMRPVAEALGHTGLAICANGAIVYDMHTDRVVEHTPITRETVLGVAAAVRAAIPDVTFAAETRDRGFFREADYPYGFPDTDDVVIGMLDEMVGDDVVKL
ncbi:MAG: HAD family hydrolase, partial [Jiangellaceae bacterium]